MENQPLIHVTRSPNRPTLAFITFQPGLLHPEITSADITLGADGLVVQFREKGALPVKENRLTLTPDMASSFKTGRHKAAWLKLDISTIILEVEK